MGHKLMTSDEVKQHALLDRVGTNAHIEVQHYHYLFSVLRILDEETNYLYGILHALKRFLVPQLSKNVPKRFNTVFTCNKQRLSILSWTSYS